MTNSPTQGAVNAVCNLAFHLLRLKIFCCFFSLADIFCSTLDRSGQITIAGISSNLKAAKNNGSNRTKITIINARTLHNYPRETRSYAPHNLYSGKPQARARKTLFGSIQKGALC